MELSTDIRFWLPALVPIVFLLVAIIKLRWRIAKASVVSMSLALLIAGLLFGSSPLALLFETGKGVWNAATILLVIWPAIYLYEITCEVKAVEAIRTGIQRITKHELLQILILGWVFPSFLQGITGFGVAVAVGAPLLLSIGVRPLYCHCTAGPFLGRYVWDLGACLGGLGSAILDEWQRTSVCRLFGGGYDLDF